MIVRDEMNGVILDNENIIYERKEKNDYYSIAFLCEEDQKPILVTTMEYQFIKSFTQEKTIQNSLLSIHRNFGGDFSELTQCCNDVLDLLCQYRVIDMKGND